MNWYRAKTILIVFLAIINVFLLYNIIFNNGSFFYINKDIVANTAEVLKNNGITINPDIIPRKVLSAKQFEADNIITGYDEFAKKALGEDVKKISDNSYEGKRGSIEFSGDRFTLVTELTADNLFEEKNARAFLKSFGIDISDYKYENGVFKKSVDKLDLFNTEISIKQQKDGKIQISGVWFEQAENTVSEETELKPITSVLVDFISSPQRPEGNPEISNLTLGYIVYDTELYHKSMVPIPVWKIEFSTGNYVYMDARSNE